MMHWAWLFATASDAPSASSATSVLGMVLGGLHVFMFFFRLGELPPPPNAYMLGWMRNVSSTGK